jgi:hypothetical protein
MIIDNIPEINVESEWKQVIERRSKEIVERIQRALNNTPFTLSKNKEQWRRKN